MKYLRKIQKQNPKRKDLVFLTSTRSICNAGRAFAFPDIHFFKALFAMLSASRFVAGSTYAPRATLCDLDTACKYSSTV